MNDNPTPQEIEAFEKANPGIVADEKATQPLPQWPIRVALMLLPLLCFWEWAWFKKATKKLPIVLLLLCVSANAQPTVIISSNGAPRLWVKGVVTVTNSAVAGCGPVEDGANLIGWWTFDVDARDSSGAGNNGILIGSPTIGTAVITNGVALNGSTQWVNVLTGEFNNTAALTVMAWIKTSATGGEVLSVGVSDWEFCIDVGTTSGGGSEGKPSIFSHNAGAWASCSSTINNGSWHHIAATCSSGTTSFYVDGAFVNSVSQTSPGTSPEAGVDIGNRGGGGILLNGSLDDCRIYGVAESSGTISIIYANGQSGHTGTGTGCP